MGISLKWVRRATIALCALIVLVVVAGLPLYVFPPQGDVDSADLVYVIGPPRAPRIDLERRLLDEGVAPAALISVSPDPPKGSESTASTLEECREKDVTCASPTPFTTKGEALLLAEYAATHDVDKTIVITFTPHVARTRYIFAKCYAGDVTVVGVDEHLSLTDWIYQYAYQTTAFVKAWLTPCADLEE